MNSAFALADVIRYYKLMKLFRAKPTAPLGASLVVLSSLFYASYGIWTKLMGNFFGGYTASGLRSIVVLFILVPIAVAYHRLQPIGWRRNWRHLLGLAFTSALIWGPLYFAILHAGVGVSLTLNYASIVIGMFFFGWIFNRERLTRDKWLSAGLGLLGLWLVFAPNVASVGWLALAGACLSGFSNAAHYVIAKKIPYNATQSTIAIWVSAVVSNLPMAVLIGEPRPAIGWHVQWLYLVFFAFASIAASWSLVGGMKLIDAGAAGVLGLLEIVFGVLFGALFFGERPGLLVLSGVVIIIAAAAVPYIKDYNAKRGTLDGS